MKRKWKLLATMLGVAVFATGMIVFMSGMTVKASNEETSQETTQSKSIIGYILGKDTYTDEEIAVADINKDNVLNLRDILDTARLEEYGEDYQKIMDERNTENPSDDEADASETPQDSAKPEDSDVPKESTVPETTKAPEATTAPTESDSSSDEKTEKRVVYIDIAESGWTEAYIYSWTGGEQLTPMTLVEGQKGIYMAELPDGVEEFLCINNDDKVWDNGNQSVNVTYQKSGMVFTLSQLSGEKYTGNWSIADF